MKMSIPNVNAHQNSDGSLRVCTAMSKSNMKYDDADLHSKRRKSEHPPLHEDEHENEHQSNEGQNVDGYVNFKNAAIERRLNSSFEESCDFKGGVVVETSCSLSLPPAPPLSSSSSASALSPPSSPLTNASSTLNETSAKNNLTITTRPILTSKGLGNTFKLLESQLENNYRKALNKRESINKDIDIKSPLERANNPQHLDLELEARERMCSIVANAKSELIPNESGLTSTPLLKFLYDFVSKGLPDEVLTPLSEEKINFSKGDNSWDGMDLIYYASKSVNGKNCLKIVRTLLLNKKVLCGNRVSQMTRAYDDIEAVTRLLEEKEKDLELTVQIGKELLTQNNSLENKITELEAELKSMKDERAQLAHDLQQKNDLIAVLTNADEGSEVDTPTSFKSISVDLLQKRINNLQDENRSLKMEASQLASETDSVEARERQLMEDVTAQLNDANSQFENLCLELERQREENRLQHEQIVSLTARLGEAEMRLHQVTQDNDEHMTLLNITKENQSSLAIELVEFKQRYQEVLALLQETQEQLRNQRRKTMPQARSSFISGMSGGALMPESLQSELMESSMYSENSLDSGISGDNPRANDRISRLMSQLPGMYVSTGSSDSTQAIGGAGVAGAAGVPPYKRVFETVRCASKAGNYVDTGTTSMTQLGAMSMSSSSGPRMSAMPYNGGSSHPAGSFYRDSGYDNNSMGMMRTLSIESLASQSDDGYPTQPSGVPGAPGAKELEAALKRLTPAEVLARRAMLSYAPAGTYNYDEPAPVAATLPQGIRTPDSIMSIGSSGISSSSTNMSSQWRLPEKLQIVKPIEGSQTLHHWSRLATPTFGGLLEERPGVTIRGGRCLDDLGMQMYTLSDVEEDVSDDLPGKQFELSGCTYTFTTSTVMHPDDGLVNDLSFLSQSQMSSRMASTSTSRQPSCPPTPRGGLSRKNSCSTFSVNLGLASMLNERGIKAITPSALNTPAGPNFSPTVTPCNSPEGSPTRSISPEPLFGILSTGADLIRRKLMGDIDRPNRNQQKHRQKVMLSRLERRTLRSLRLVEKVQSIGLENIIVAQPNAMSQIGSGIASRSSSPMAQLTSLKHLHASANANNVIEDLHFDRDQLKGVIHRGLSSPLSAGSRKSSTGSNAESDITKKVTAAQAASLASQHTKSEAGDGASVASTSHAHSTSTTDARAKHLQRQKSRRGLKNGIAQQRPDLGTISGRVRTDLGKVSPVIKGSSDHTAAAKGKADEKAREPQSITQAFVGSISSLLFGRKGGWL